jgi:hypothetical protein
MGREKTGIRIADGGREMRLNWVISIANGCHA